MSSSESELEQTIVAIATGSRGMGTFCEDRICIVTGAGRGIGREYALRLAEHGAKVVVNDLGGARDGAGTDQAPADEVVAEIKAAGGEAVANKCDVTSFPGAKEMIDQAVETYGRLDVLINNAGILRDRMIVNMTEQEWDSVTTVHLKGTFAPSHHAAVYWRNESKKGNPVDARLINTTSVSGLFGNAGQANYGAAKAGIANFTIIASRELGRYGVRVNGIAPAALTRLTEDLMPEDLSDEMREAQSPGWVAPIVVWLASRDSHDVSGRIFEASGSRLAVAEGWHRGPRVDPVNDPTMLGPVVRDLVQKARLNSSMTGEDFDGGLA